MKYKVVLIFCIIAISATLFSNTPLAEIKPEDAIKFRQSGYTFMRWNMGEIKKQVVSKPETYNKEQVIAAANVIAAISNSGLWSLFSEKTATGKGWKETRVKAEFFEQPDEVKKRAKVFKNEANELARVAGIGDVNMIKDQFDTLLKVCKACHKKFRTKD